MAAEDSDTPLIVRVPVGPAARAARTVEGLPRAGAAHEQEGLGWVARGVAKVVKPGPVRARALVPGALSLPRPRPSRSLRLGQAAAPFPRRVFPTPDAARPTPPLRTAVPTDSGQFAHAAGGREGAGGDEPEIGPIHPVDGSEHPVIMDAPSPVPGAVDPASDQLSKDGPDPVPKKGLGRRAVLPVAAALVAAFVAGTGYLAVSDRPLSDLGRWGATAESTTAPVAGGAPAGSAGPGAERPAGDPFGNVAAAPTGPPTRLRAGAIKVDTPLETLQIGGDGALQPPKVFAKAGWYAGGTAPGDTGPAVIAGHVDSKSGPAVFFRLRELAAGDRIDVVRGGATVSFTVTAIRWYPKSEFPTDEVYGPTPDRQLRLITCGGVFDRSLRSYRDNLVVYAVAG
ncbi:class F sortase [Actinoplanes sp. M2I2]|uniref:class F sortase n=1 Tax=Actinoplanes sp. M2I2 TaxID=1734444 RepID=UPI002020A047|nr:class F sortase [Actinoplanes sp. M2I2]